MRRSRPCVVLWRGGVWLGSLFFFQAEGGVREVAVTGVQTCALPIYHGCRERRQPPCEAGREDQIGGADQHPAARRKPALAEGVDELLDRAGVDEPAHAEHPDDQADRGETEPEA